MNGVDEGEVELEVLVEPRALRDGESVALTEPERTKLCALTLLNDEGDKERDRVKGDDDAEALLDELGEGEVPTLAVIVGDKLREGVLLERLALADRDADGVVLGGMLRLAATLAVTDGEAVLDMNKEEVADGDLDPAALLLVEALEEVDQDARTESEPDVLHRGEAEKEAL